MEFSKIMTTYEDYLNWLLNLVYFYYLDVFYQLFNYFSY